MYEAGTAVDTSSEMALFARNLAHIATLTGQQRAAAGFRAGADKLAGVKDYTQVAGVQL